MTTYDRRGWRKKGVKLNEHGLIFSGQHPGSIKGITKTTLHVNLAPRGEPISNPSYINCGRIYTVDTNVKVKNVGFLDAKSLQLLLRYYSDVNFQVS